MNDNIIYTSSSMEKNTPLLDKIIQLRGTSGQDAPLEGKGGKGGVPGCYGCDHVIYIDGPYSGNTSNKGDYSNYLLEEPTGSSSVAIACPSGKYKSTNRVGRGEVALIKPGSIAHPESCDLYAKRSISFDLQAAAAAVAATVAAIACGWWLAPLCICVSAIGVSAVAVGVVAAGKL